VIIIKNYCADKVCVCVCVRLCYCREWHLSLEDNSATGLTTSFSSYSLRYDPTQPWNIKLLDGRVFLQVQTMEFIWHLDGHNTTKVQQGEWTVAMDMKWQIIRTDIATCTGNWYKSLLEYWRLKSSGFYVLPIGKYRFFPKALRCFEKSLNLCKPTRINIQQNLIVSEYRC